MPKPQTRPIVVIESPYRARSASEAARNLTYLRRACRDSWDRGENPVASHGFYPMFLNDSDPALRIAGIEAGYAFWPLATLVAFYVDMGFSHGMSAAHRRAEDLGITTELRTIGAN
jgi:hypothetical protein